MYEKLLILTCII